MSILDLRVETIESTNKREQRYQPLQSQSFHSFGVKVVWKKAVRPADQTGPWEKDLGIFNSPRVRFTSAGQM